MKEPNYSSFSSTKIKHLEHIVEFSKNFVKKEKV